jgi:hypothetical protein
MTEVLAELVPLIDFLKRMLGAAFWSIEGFLSTEELKITVALGGSYCYY